MVEDSQFVHCQVRMTGLKVPFYVSFVYGRNTVEERKELWHKIPICTADSWIVMGDFNAVFKANERDGGKPISKAEIVDSSQWFNNSQLEVLKQTGSFFTWTNNQEGQARIYSKIDHAFANEKWRFKSVVMDSWSKFSQGNGLRALYYKLLRLKHQLKQFNKDQIGDIGFQFQKAKSDFQEARLLAQRFPGDIALQNAAQTAAECFGRKDQMYHSFLMQRSKIDWIRKGDSNTAYFHAYLKKRRAENKIASFINEQGNLVDNFSESPGPDGFGSGFFKVVWQEVGSEVCLAINQIFDTGKIPEGFLDTTLSLIPKCENPSKASDYRPIACCTTIYKCISKLICSRLAKVLPGLVQANQGAFVKGRSIAHNIMIFQDLIKNYGRSAASPRCAIKIDISKAYDTVDWWFVGDLLSELCFPEKFIKWIMSCLTNTSYLLLMNGRVQGKFKGEKGLRQGDPLSPLLFVLIMEYLTRRLQMAACVPTFRYHPMCKSLNLLNLCFADDLLLFCKGNLASVQVLREALEEFSLVSGLVINTNKSHVYFGGIPADQRQKMATELHLTEGSFPLKYLGVPMRPTKWKHEDCDIIVQKFRMRIHSWASRHLSYVGRIQLIHSVLFGLRNYWMGIFILPQSIIKEIEKLCRSFLWGVNGNRNKIHLASWNKVCLPKAYGGLGFRNGLAWNKAILAKYIWAITERLDLLWVKWINAVYFKGTSFWPYQVSQDSSWYWKKLCKLRELYTFREVFEAGYTGKFHSALLYNSSLCQQQVGYHRAVWCRLSVPKHRFVLWQTVNSYLLTCDNLVRFTVRIESQLCPVCGMVNEFHGHLFFDCYLSRQVIKFIFSWLGFQAWPMDFSSWLVWLANRRTRMIADICFSLLAAVVYGVWKNRNHYVFDNCSWTTSSISSGIIDCMKYRFFTVKNRNLSGLEQRFLSRLLM
ncbi:uncharacterized protein LOC133796085 [Humulus lupulus]|uniref:uncharacterized protein LOC133796085 n=1 Tax=Humulus lupulus TaxID=3486 RepID=UPI002B40C196|nr:uncharacterized protein LOC133796085 [Humulus lupulus]